MLAFKDITTTKEIRSYSLNVLSRTGNKSKDKTMLYHYSNIASIYSILSSGYIILRSSEKMNDYVENDFIDSTNNCNRLFFSCFSKSEENLAMYKIYTNITSGATIAISFQVAQSIINNINNIKNSVYIVRDNIITKESIEADVYWASIMYKDLYTDTIQADTVSNSHFKNPMNNPELAGLIKMRGWEYEKEVRLCALTEKALNINEDIAIKLPKDFEKNVTIITAPGFIIDNNRKEVARLKRLGVSIHNSEYDGLVNMR